MIETEQATTPVKPTVEAVVDAALHRTLRVLARVSRRQGSTYDGPALLIARELFPDKVTVRTWPEVYGGIDWSRDSWYDLAYYSGRGYSDRVSVTALQQEYQGTVSRETVAPVLTVTDVQTRTCTCDACEDSECTGTCSEVDVCDDHGCTQCQGDGYQCDDHDCDTCYSGHSTCDSCGYCSECDSHQGERDHHSSEICPNCSWCRECDHDCNDY